MKVSIQAKRSIVVLPYSPWERAILPRPVRHDRGKSAMSSRGPNRCLGQDERPMTDYRQSYARREEAPSSAFCSMPRTKSVVAGVVRTLNVTIAEVLYAYARTGMAFATLMVLARRAAPWGVRALRLPREGRHHSPWSASGQNRS